MKIIVNQLNFIIGDLEGNTKKILDKILEKKHLGSDNIMVFSELCISGYPPLDLVDNDRFISDQEEKFNYLCEQTKDVEYPIVLGMIEKNNNVGKNLYNSAIIIQKGQIVKRYQKRLLPTYDIFDEARYFEPGSKMGLWLYKGYRIGLLICEDFWYNDRTYNVNPSEELFKANADFIIAINASPSVIGKTQKRFKIAEDIGKNFGIPVCYVNQVGGNDDIVFDGNSFVTDKNGNIVFIGKDYHEDQFAHDVESKETFNDSGSAPVVRVDRYTDKTEFFFKQARRGIKDYVKKCGFKKVVIGESGGIDSAVVTALAVAAIGADNVTAITMPTAYSSEGSYKDSEILCKNLGVKIHNLSIQDCFKQFLYSFNMQFDPQELGVTEQNIQARLRGMILMAYSNRYGSLVLSTGNKSELSVGFCTIYGDMCGGMSPINDLYKMEVYALARYINETFNEEIIPKSILDKEPSAELLPGQKDTDSLPPYPILDAMLKIMIEGVSLSPGDKKEAMDKLVGVPNETYEKIRGMVRKNEYKRRQAPIGIKMHEKSFGYGRRIPIAQNWIE